MSEVQSRQYCEWVGRLLNSFRKGIPAKGLVLQSKGAHTSSIVTGALNSMCSTKHLSPPEGGVTSDGPPGQIKSHHSYPCDRQIRPLVCVICRGLTRAEPEGQLPQSPHLS